MSIESISHVFNLENVGDPTRKLILMGLANHGDKDGRGCFPRNETLAKYGCCSVRTVQRHIKQLLIDGFICEGDQGLVAHRPYYSRPNVYDVAMSEEQRIEWAGDNDPDDGNRGPAVRGGKKGALVRFPAPVDGSNAVEQGDGPSTRPGDNLTPGHFDVPGDNLSGGPGDNLSGGPGDTHVTPPVTPVTRPGDTGVTLTINEPSMNRHKDGHGTADAAPLMDPLFEQIEPTPDVQASTEPSVVRSSGTKGTRIPGEFKVTDEMRGWAQSNGFGALPLEQITEEFFDYWVAQPGSKGVKLDWFATWRNWIRRDQQFTGRERGRTTTTSTGEGLWGQARRNA